MVYYRQVEPPGRLTTSRLDFYNHTVGLDFRHKADQIDMNPVLNFAPVVPPDITTVQGTLEAMLNLIKNGNDFVSIGDGYQSMGTYTITDGYADVEECFAAAFDALRFNHYGGIILLKSGLYNFTRTVPVPAGISIFGEIGGTVINATIDLPVFEFLECPDTIVNYAHLPPPSTISVDGYQANKLCNLTFIDNYQGPSAVLTSATSCFILLQNGSNVEVDRCTFLGKYEGTGVVGTTTRNVFYMDVNATDYNTLLCVQNSSIFCTQKIIDYTADLTKSGNKLIFNHNKVWCSGVIGALTLPDASIISSYPCDIQACNNDVNFGFDIANKTALCFVYCYQSASYMQTIMIVGNSLKNVNGGNNYNNIFRIPATLVGGHNLRCIITSNTCFGYNDSDPLQIVVGDGENTIGDINGIRALEYIYDSFMMPLDPSDADISKQHEQVTIYLKFGSYIIEDYFTNSDESLPYRLIGVPHDGNLPTITLSATAPAANGQMVYLGNYFENINFVADGSYMYYICPNGYYVKPDSRQIYVKDVFFKNCTFNCCGIYFSNAAIATDTNYNGIISVENCHFRIVDSLSNATYRFAIFMNLPNYKLIVKNCSTKNPFYGQFVHVEPNSTYCNNDVVIEECYIDCYGTGDPIIGSIIEFGDVAMSYGIRSINIINNIISIANGTTNIPWFSVMAITNLPLTQLNAECNIIGNTFIGYDTSDFLGSTYLIGFQRINIQNNVVRACPVGFYVDLSTADTNLYPYNINIKNNNYIASTNSYAFCSVNTLLSAPSLELPGVINICDNNIDMTLKGNDSNRFPTLYSLFNASYIGVIFVDVAEASVNISGNYICPFKTDQATVDEAAICCLNHKSVNISKNTIDLKTLNISRYISSIYCGQSVYNATNDYSVKITENKITHRGGGVSPTDEHEKGIYTASNRFVTIEENQITGIASSGMTRFIHAQMSTTVSCIGTICHNTIYSDTGAHEDDASIIYMEEGLVTYNVCKMTVNNNKGQKYYKDINCYEFIPYGCNSLHIVTPVFVKNDGYPECTAAVLANDKSDLFYLSDHSNLNFAKQMDIATAVPAWGLDRGLYYTNATAFPVIDLGYPLDAICENTGGEPRLGYKHQTLIPIHIDDFVRLIDIDIPIYIYSDTTSTVDFIASASLVIANTVDDGTRIECIPGPVLLWEYNITNIIAGGAANTALHHTRLDGYDVWLTPYRKATAIGGPSSQAYIVLAMHTILTPITIADVSQTNVYFAIPYARITFSY